MVKSRKKNKYGKMFNFTGNQRNGNLKLDITFHLSCKLFLLCSMSIIADTSAEKLILFPTLIQGGV